MKKQNPQRINEDIDAKKARNLMYAIKSVISGKRDVGFVDLNKKVIGLLEKNNIGVIPVRMSSSNTIMSIIYRNKERALRLYEIAKSKGGYLNDKTAEEAREIGQLLGYTAESINQYIWDKYISKLPRSDDDSKYNELDESDSFFTKDPFADFESKYRREQNQKDIIFFARDYQSSYSSGKNVAILKNPQSLENVSAGTRGVIDSAGNLYVEQDTQLIHIDIVEILGRLDLIKYDNDYMPWLMPKYYITVIRLGKTNTFYLGGESGGMIPHDKRTNLYEPDQLDDIPEVEQARPIYQKFLNAAKKKNPNIKFINEVLGYTYTQPLKESEELKGLDKKVIETVKDAGGNDVKICAVNGTFVKGKNPGLGFIQFVEGGHHYVDSYPGYRKHIPEDEIWVDNAFLDKLDDFHGIAGHEWIERNLMKYKKMSYDKAHEIANKKETLFRGRKEKLNESVQIKNTKRLFEKLKIIIFFI